MVEVETRDDARAGSVRLASGLNILAGIWVALSPFVSRHPGSVGSLWNSVIVGAGVIIIAAIRLGDRTAFWPSWLNVMLGLWTIISPWVYGYTDSPAQTWSSLIAGAIITLLGGWSATAGASSMRP